MQKQSKRESRQKSNGEAPKNEEVIEAILRVGMYVQSELEAALQKIGLSPANFEVLTTLASHPEGILSTALAGKLHCTKANISQLVTRMEKSGLIQRVASSKDKRSSILKLTTLGKSQAAAANEARIQTEKKILKKFTLEERRALVNVMAPLTKD